VATIPGMATMITDECINCGACEPECPNTAIYQGGVEWDGTDGAKHPALVNEFFYIVPEKCTECVGFFDHEACAAVCPVDCCVPNPQIPESEAVLLDRARALHPDKTFADDAPSRFKAGGQAAAPAGDGAAPAPSKAPAAPAPAAAPVATAIAVAPEDALAAKVPLMEDWEVPLTCFRCQGRFEVPFQYTTPGTVLHCPHCGGSFVPNTPMYQAISERIQKFYASWTHSFDELRARRRAELDRFAEGQDHALRELHEEIARIASGAELAGAPQRSRGFFG
jgi:ferredoxin